MAKTANDSPVIGYITPAIYSSYYRLLLSGVQRAARERGAQLLVFQMTSNEVVDNSLAWESVDGWVACFSDRNSGGFDELARSGKPLVMISQPITGAPFVHTDNTAGMRSVIQHLLALGHRRIAFIGWQGNPDMPDRLFGYRQALAEYQVAFDPALVFMLSGGWSADGEAFAKRLIDDGLSIPALAFAGDNLALSAMRTFRQAGIRVPEDLVITGFDDMPEAQIATPPLTTVRMRFDAMSRAATEHLLDILAGAAPAHEPISIPMALVVRRSAGELPDLVGMPDHNANGGDPATLARRLAEGVGSPETLAPDEPAERLWPQVGTIIAAINAAITNTPSPDDSALQSAWSSAMQIASYADPLQDALMLIEAALPTGDNDMEQRKAAMLYRLRTTLLRICIGGQIERINRSEAALAFSDTSARLLADSDLEHVCGLGWLTGSGITTALLGLWQRDEPGALLRIAGRFPSSSDTTQLGMRAAMFPPMALLESDQFAPVTILPLRSARRKWGFLALAFLETLESAAFDCAPLLAALLTARIEGAMLQREREAEQAALQTAFERERSLAETIRELGCPVLPISQAILLVPLIGVIDSYRAEQILGTVVRTIEQSRTETVLLDVTGVPLIDTHVAGMLIQLAQMLRLLGARTILVGVRPEIAQSIVALGVNLDQLTTYSSLMAALAALKQ